MTKKSELKNLHVRVRPEMHDFLKQSAEARGLTMNAMVIFALEMFFQQQQVLPHMDKIMDEYMRQMIGESQEK